MTLNERREAAVREHTDGMAELKQELDHKILAEAGRSLESVAAPQPFGVTMADIVEERKRLIDAAEAAVKRGWRHVINADQQMQAIEDEGEYEDDSASCHDEFAAGIEADKQAALGRLDELQRLIQAFNDARLDVYNALRAGDVKRAQAVASSFVRRPAIAPKPQPR